jgi:hypothetical protein
LYSVPKGCKTFYKRFNEQLTISSISSQEKWCRDLNIVLDKSDWNAFYNLPFRTSIDTNLRYFQYRVLHRILTTNRFLHIIHIADHDLCSFCNNTSETLVHLFVECEYVIDVWLELNKWLVKNGFTNLGIFSKIDIILGIEGVDIIVNLCLQIAKISIYRCKLKNCKPTFAAVKANIKHIMHVEQYIAQTNNNMNKFYGKWSSLFHSLH